MTPLVSVLMPVRNGGRKVVAALRSITAQTVHDTEIIVIDDGSTDATFDIVLSLAKIDRRIKIIRQGQAGIVAALNRGIMQAHGRFLARMDADDSCPMDRFEKQLSFFEGHPEIAVLGGNIRWLKESGEELGVVEMPLVHDEIYRKLRSPADFWAMCHMTVMVNRTKIPDWFSYNQQFRFAEDYDLWLRLSRVSEFANLPEVLADVGYEPRSLRRRRPYLAFKSVLAAWIIDLLSIRLGTQFTTDFRHSIKVSDIPGLVRHAGEDLEAEALVSAIFFAWRLGVDPRLAARIWRYLCASFSRSSPQKAFDILAATRLKANSLTMPDAEAFDDWFVRVGADLACDCCQEDEN